MLNRSLLGLRSLFTESLALGMRREVGRARVAEPFFLLSKVAAPVPWAEGELTLADPVIWSWGGKFAVPHQTDETRLGLFCHAMPGARPLLPDFP